MLTFQDKEKIFQLILNQLESEYKQVEKIANDSKKDATDSDTKQESKYDTRRIEASYLAGAQLKRLKELEIDFKILKSFKLESFKINYEVNIGALISLNSKLYFISPLNKGLNIKYKETQINVISRSAPISNECIGLTKGDIFEVDTPKGLKEYKIDFIL